MTIIAYIITLNKANMAEKDFLVKDQDTRVNDDSRVNQNSSEDQDNWFFGRHIAVAGDEEDRLPNWQLLNSHLPNG